MWEHNYYSTVSQGKPQVRLLQSAVRRVQAQSDFRKKKKVAEVTQLVRHRWLFDAWIRKRAAERLQAAVRSLAEERAAKRQRVAGPC